MNFKQNMDSHSASIVKMVHSVQHNYSLYTEGLIELKSQELSRNMSITSHMVSAAYVCFQRLIEVAYCVTTRGFPQKSVYYRLQTYPNLEQICVKVTYTISYFSGRDWQSSWTHNFHSLSFMICHTRAAAQCSRQVHDFINAPNDKLGFATHVSVHRDGVQVTNLFLSLTGRKIFLIYCTRDTVLLWRLSFLYVLLYFLILAYICAQYTLT